MTRGEEHNAKTEKVADERIKAVKERREISGRGCWALKRGSR